MLHLHPNAVLILATFAYACEAFVGVMPSVALFRHWREWRRNWYFILVDSLSPHLLVPSAPAESLANSRDVSSQDEALLPVIRRLTELRESQLTCTMITGDYVR